VSNVIAIDCFVRLIPSQVRAVIAAYDYALQFGGESEGLDRALALYRSYRPGVPVSRAKAEVWKILERQYVEVEPAPEIPYIFCE
jgi:hypothetical protein